MQITFTRSLLRPKLELGECRLFSPERMRPSSSPCVTVGASQNGSRLAGKRFNTEMFRHWSLKDSELFLNGYKFAMLAKQEQQQIPSILTRKIYI